MAKTKIPLQLEKLIPFDNVNEILFFYFLCSINPNVKNTKEFKIKEVITFCHIENMINHHTIKNIFKKFNVIKIRKGLYSYDFTQFVYDYAKNINKKTYTSIKVRELTAIKNLKNLYSHKILLLLLFRGSQFITFDLLTDYFNINPKNKRAYKKIFKNSLDILLNAEIIREYEIKSNGIYDITYKRYGLLHNIYR